MGYSLWGRKESGTTELLHSLSLSLCVQERETLRERERSKDFPGGPECKEYACNAGHLGLISGLGRSLEKGMATHSNIIAWRIPWTEELGGL